MRQVRISLVSGGTYPVQVYIADVFGNNESFLGVIDPGPVPPEVAYNVEIPPIFEMASQVMIILRDVNNCEIFHILDCDYGCAFEIILTGVVEPTPTPSPTVTPTETVTPTVTPTETPTPTPTQTIFL